MGTAWIIVGVAVGIIVSLGAGLMTMPDNSAHIGACIAFVIAGIALVITGATWWWRHPKKEWTVHMRALGLIIIALTATPIMMWFAWPIANAQPSPSVSGNCNNFGNNNFNCNQVNIGAVPRRLSPDQMQTLSNAMASSGATGSVEVLTDVMACPDCDGFAKQLEAGLRAAPGLKVTPLRNGLTALSYKGIALGVRDPNSPPASAIAIVNGFRSLGNLTMVKEVPDGDNESVLHIAQPNIP